MKKLFGEKSDSELQAREALRRGKWQRALVYYEKKLQENERDFALWNLVGDLQMNNQARAQAVEAWRRALEGYALEGLFENVLGVARKILRRAPEEEDLHLIVAEAYLGLEYYADCLTAFRSYLKLSKHRSESDMRSLFKKILDARIPHAHLLEEIRSLYKDSGIEDIELERRLKEFIETNRQAAATHTPAHSPVESDEPEAEERRESSAPTGGEDLVTLNGLSSFEEETMPMYGFASTAGAPPSNSGAADDFSSPAASEPRDIPPGEGKDHYDLGMVYKEMALWDAAIAEFEQARQDRSVRIRATLALAECLQESNDLQGALTLLENERRSGESSPAEHLPLIHQIGLVHELLGNLEEALSCFELVRARQPGYGDVESRIASLQNRLGAGDEA